MTVGNPVLSLTVVSTDLDHATRGVDTLARVMLGLAADGFDVTMDLHICADEDDDVDAEVPDPEVT